MQKYEVQRTDYEPLVFEGDLLGTARSANYETEQGTRSYELSLYALADGGYVISIAYLTTCAQERSIIQAEILDAPQDVEEMLLVFEPCDPVDRKALGALPEEQRRRLRRKLCSTYDEQVSEILDVLKNHYGDWQGETKPAEQSASPPMRGILAFLRMK
jgi:hypothetical protein